MKIFKPEMYWDPSMDRLSEEAQTALRNTFQYAAFMSQQILDRALAHSPIAQGRCVEKVQGIGGMWMWCTGEENGLADCTHRARLMNIEEIPK